MVSAAAQGFQRTGFGIPCRGSPCLLWDKLPGLESRVADPRVCYRTSCRLWNPVLGIPVFVTGQAAGFGIPCWGSRCLLQVVAAPSSPTPAGVCASDCWGGCFGSNLCDHPGSSATLPGLALQGSGTCLGDTSSHSHIKAPLAPSPLLALAARSSPSLQQQNKSLWKLMTRSFSFVLSIC